MFDRIRRRVRQGSFALGVVGVVLLGKGIETGGLDVEPVGGVAVLAAAVVLTLDWKLRTARGPW